MRRSGVAPIAARGAALVARARPAGARHRSAEDTAAVLRAAVATDGWKLDVENLSSADGRRVNLRLTNRDDDVRLAVDLCGGRARARGTARVLAVDPRGPARARDRAHGGRNPDEVVVDFAAGAERTLIVQTCRARRRAADRVRSNVSGSPRSKPARADVARLLRWWAGFPATPQACVNAAVWTGRDRVLLERASTAPPRSRGGAAACPAVAARGGAVYQVGEGRLTSLDAAGVRLRLRLRGRGRPGGAGTRSTRVFPISNWQAELRRLVRRGRGRSRPGPRSPTSPRTTA